MDISLQTQATINRGRGRGNRGRGRRGRSSFYLIADIVLKIKQDNLYHSHKIKKEEEEAIEEEVDLINQTYNVITAKNIDILRVSVGRNKQTRIEEELMFPTWKRELIQCFYHAQQ